MDKCVFGPGGSKPHPDANPSTTISWPTSDKGKAWAAKGEKRLVTHKDLKGNNLGPSEYT